MIFRVRYWTLPSAPHIHCAVFVAPGENRTFARCGSFTLRREEFEALRQAFEGVEFVPDGTATPPASPL